MISRSSVMRYKGAGKPLREIAEETQQADDLRERMKESIDKLARDKTSRGDLKILSRTLRELRYAFKVFAPYRRQRKITMFGSARTFSQPRSVSAAMLRQTAPGAKVPQAAIR